MSRGAQQARANSIVLLICLLLLAQGAGSVMVLCVSGPNHVEFEAAGMRCCLHPKPHDAGVSRADDGSCIGCTDLPLQTALRWEPSHRPHTFDAPALVLAVSGDELLPPAAVTDVVRADDPPKLPSGLCSSASPLRC